MTHSHLEGILKCRFLGLPSKASGVLIIDRLGVCSCIKSRAAALVGRGISIDVHRNSLMAASLSEVRFFHFRTFLCCCCLFIVSGPSGLSLQYWTVFGDPPGGLREQERKINETHTLKGWNLSPHCTWWLSGCLSLNWDYQILLRINKTVNYFQHGVYHWCYLG